MRPSLRLSALSLALAAMSSLAMAKSPAEWQQLVAQSKLTLNQAIVQATQAVPGTVIDAELDDGDLQAPHYAVEIITPAGESVEVKVDAVSGQAGPAKHDGKAKNKDMQRLKAAKTSMQQAIEAATAHTPGTAVGAELDNHWGTTSYQVNVLQADGQMMEVKINAANAQVLRAKRD
ncbi:PepSY domain-containing protein [Comamonas sp. GB3 AK4-5]|uniref:PepSY domain-containing protein n=1 Tax=Comamonas sp. GB3 AK4-5 TaxID=3231487 RepID=UPI00351F329D